jgi:hypothetical protein
MREPVGEQLRFDVAVSVAVFPVLKAAVFEVSRK